MLLLGALLGKILGNISVSYLGISNIYILNFITLAMAGYFSAVVKAPITGIILIMEMTGSFSNLLSLSIVVIIAYLTSDILKNEPIYEKDGSQISVEERIEDMRNKHWFEKMALEMEIENLEEKEKLIIMMRYYGDYNQEAVAKRLNISQVQVSRLEKKIIQKLRNNLLQE